MPRTRFDRLPPIDVLKAVILERKLVHHMTYEQIAAAAGVNADHLRKLMSATPTEDWSPAIKKAVCRQLGINIQTTLSMMTDTGIRIQ